jgi:hypothetical protein
MFKMYVGLGALTSYQGAMFRQPTSSVHRVAHHHHRMPPLQLPSLIHTHNNRNMAHLKVSNTPHRHILPHSLLDITKILMLHLHNKIPIQAQVKVNLLSRHQMFISLPTPTVVIPAMDMKEEMPRPGIQELVMIMSPSTLLPHLVWATLLPPHLRMPV